MPKFLLLSILLFLTKICFGQCELQTKTITIFKGATVFIEKEGACDVKNQELYLDIPYQSNEYSTKVFRQPTGYEKNHVIIGTLDVTAKNNKILTLKSIKTPEKTEKFNSMSELLAKNVGKKINVSLKDDSQNIEGTIYNIEQVGNRRQIATLVIVENEKWHIIDIADIATFEFIDTPQLSKPAKKSQLLVTLKDNKKKQDIQMSYLQKGITWTPNYFINIKDNKNLELILKANIVNDVEKLINANINLVVGIPHFKYGDVIEPLVSDINVLDFIANIKNLDNNNASFQNMSNGFTSQVLNKQNENYNYDLNTKVATDGIFLYQLKGIDLEKSSNASLEILKTNSTYKNVYIAKLGANYNSSYYGKDKADNFVWHALSFKNNTDVPLTTGTAFFKKYNKPTQTSIPLSQNELNFTPPHQNCIVKVAVTPYVTVNNQDIEISRERDPETYSELIVMEGKMEVVNFKSEKIDMIINRNIQGSMISDANKTWELLESNRKSEDPNPYNLLKWSMELAPNEKKEIVYQYTFQRLR
ncbi:MAG: hypothetical protein ACPG5B_08065 [Chitinophagales bacterium]